MAQLEERYSKAMYELIREEGNLEGALHDAELFRNSLDDVTIRDYLEHPKVKDREKKVILYEAFKEQVEPIWFNFLDLIIDKNREAILTDVLDDFINRANRALGHVKARVVSAQTLSQERLAAIAEALTDKSELNIIFEVEVDPDLIGGFYILIDGQIFDSTIRNEINQLTEHLKRKGVAHGK